LGSAGAELLAPILCGGVVVAKQKVVCVSEGQAPKVGEETK
jgi:hypothetical protein